jgi:hypothetical protein
MRWDEGRWVFVNEYWGWWYRVGDILSSLHIPFSSHGSGYEARFGDVFISILYRAPLSYMNLYSRSESGCSSNLLPGVLACST